MKRAKSEAGCGPDRTMHVRGPPAPKKPAPCARGSASSKAAREAETRIQVPSRVMLLSSLMLVRVDREAGSDNRTVMAVMGRRESPA